MYKFQKVQLNYGTTQLNYDWMLVIESLDDLINYHNKSFYSKIKSAWDNLIKCHEGKAHFDNNLSIIINLEADAQQGKKV